MGKPKLSVVLAVFNEGEVLSKCLESIKSIADEIVISDGGSSDNTVEIAKTYKAKVLHMPNNQNFHINKNNAILHATGDWILQLDADEVVSPQLGLEISKVISNPAVKENGFWIKRKNWFLNRFLSKGGQYPDPTLRLYRRDKGKLPAKDVHEQAQVEGQVGELGNDLLHYRDLTFEKYLGGFNRYSSFIAGQLKTRNIDINFFNAIKYLTIKPMLVFAKIYIRHRGYVDGFAGFVFALFSGLIYPVAYIKLWQQVKFPATK